MNKQKQETKNWESALSLVARRQGLEFYPIIFEILDWDELNEVVAYWGLPDHYQHWKHGEEYEHLQKRYSYGLGKIYEIVINNVPAAAYLLSENKLIDHKTVIAHVFAHVDFFKNNVNFAKCRRDMLNESGVFSELIERYKKEIGDEKIEKFITDCLMINNLIDTRLLYLEINPMEKEADDHSEILRLKTDLEYLETFLNPPDWIEAQKKKKEVQEKEAEGVRRGIKFPARPVRDILLFLLKFAPLEEWQKNILGIIRQESYYFKPQALTKIINEGWAAYWHAKLMTERGMALSSEIVQYSLHNAGTLGSSGLNPYKLGKMILEDIEYKWDTGRHGKLWEENRHLISEELWDDFAVFQNIFEDTRAGKVMLGHKWREWCTFKNVCKNSSFDLGFYDQKALVKLWLNYENAKEELGLLENEYKLTKNELSTLRNNNAESHLIFGYQKLLEDIDFDKKLFSKFVQLKTFWNSSKIKAIDESIPAEFFEIAKKHSGKIELGCGKNKIFEIRVRASDARLIDEFLTPEIFSRYPLFSYKAGGGGMPENHWGIDKIDFEPIKRKLLFMLTDNGNPVIEVTDANYNKRRELYLIHRHEGVDLKFDEMKDILRIIYKIWQRPVYLETIVTDMKKEEKIVWWTPGAGGAIPKEKRQKEGNITIFQTTNGEKVEHKIKARAKFESPY